jgi:glycerol-3-phosphate acyltransferase PlsX
LDVTVAIDCMGGDHGPHVTVPAAVDYLRRIENANVILVGLQDAIGWLRASSCQIIAASEVVGMDDPIQVALRKKKDSSMRVAINRSGWRRRKPPSRLEIPAPDGHCALLAENARRNRSARHRTSTAQQQRGCDHCARSRCCRLRCRTLQFACWFGAGMALTGNEFDGGLAHVGEEADQRNHQESQPIAAKSGSQDLNFYGNVEGNDIFKDDGYRCL